MKKTVKVVWLIQNLVPYHHARFETFAASFDGETHLIQVTDMDPFDVLEFKAPHTSYVLHTLFPGQARSGLLSRSLRSELAACLGSIEPDCAFVSGWGMQIGQLMQLWALRHGIPVVIFSESTAYDMSRIGWREWVKKQLVGAASAALVGGQPHAEYIQQLGMPEEAVFLGHNVVDSSHFSAAAKSRPARLPDILEQKPYFVACTRFGRKKNLPRLVEAYAAYLARCRQTSVECAILAIAGDGEFREEIEKAIARHGVGGEVLLLGAVEYGSLPWLYQNSYAFVHASTTEQWGLVVNEAMAAGAPVLVSRRCGCAPDLVREGGNGFQFDPYDPAGIEDALWSFSGLPPARQQAFGAKGREIVAEWGPERFAAGLTQATTHALETGGQKHTAVARVLLHILLARK